MKINKFVWLGTLAVAVCALTAPSQAQNRNFGQQRGQQNGGRNGGQNGGQTGANGNEGLLPLPDGVRNLVSIDAHNVLLAETEDPATGQREYSVFPVRHVYSGGIARIFGGTAIPAEIFVSPAFSRNFGGGGNNGMGNNAYGNTGIGGQGGVQSLGGDNFNGQNQFGQNQFGQNQFGQGQFGQGQFGQNQFGQGQNGQNPNGPTIFIPGTLPGNPNYNLPVRQLRRVTSLLDRAPRQVAIGQR